MALLHKLRSTWAPSKALVSRSFSSLPAAADYPSHWRNPAAVLHGIDDLRFEDVPLPDKVADGHVRVAVRALGICGSDVHYYKKVRCHPVGHRAVRTHCSPAAYILQQLVATCDNPAIQFVIICKSLHPACIACKFVF